ncbi:alkaline phosphatase family protein [Isoptericola variabilis]|uniref:Type I phosphodiesterase/nucleotide pyrophosphatase n=1 Tax=Isoptericola variabilis (strain 225) TaxID=743718 RepID=F6FWG3_ISOV2|nr:nucleotide pyrophosphatase/phosphodiesterase family protein [Isoptericola variabilis]AEG44537.1 type I phosphodiesterase/nucleotide pyrophosphatase [Isoptericola variabilis 225]TWH26547.1 putative AlkP superfamily pyrophosphatase or phosphodiesterase [Isoptericola variabilis J7]
MTAPALAEGLVAPAYGTGSLAAVLPAAAGALGLELTTATGLRSGECLAALGLPAARRVVVVLVDGLGLHNLVERGGHAPFLRSLLADARSLTSSFPSTTAAALATLGTGTSPGRTGLLGYTQRNPATGGLATMVSWTEQSDPYRPGTKLSGPLGTAPEDLQREPTVLETLAAAGLPVVAPGPRKFEGSGMTRAALRGPRYVVAETLGERVDVAVRTLRETGLVYLYHGDVDKTGHQHGPDSWQWGDALEAADAELRRLVRSLPAGTLVLVTADHGQIPVDPGLQRDVATTPELARGVALLGGEPRALHVYTEPGADPADVAAQWRDVLGEDAVVVLGDDAIHAGWFGQVAGHVREAVGDVVVASTGRATVVDSRLHTAEARAMPGVHGSLTQTEMHVPLLAVVA